MNDRLCYRFSILRTDRLLECKLMQPRRLRLGALPLLAAGLLALGLSGTPCVAHASETAEPQEAMLVAPTTEGVESDAAAVDPDPTLPADVSDEQPETTPDDTVEVAEPTSDDDPSSDGETVVSPDATVDPNAAVDGTEAEAPEEDASSDEEDGQNPIEPPADDLLPATTEAAETAANKPDETIASDAIEALSTDATNSWVRENGSYYYYESGTKRTGWLVKDVTPQGVRGGLQRYWLDSTGKLAMSRLIPASESGWWAYAQPLGIIVRGKWTDSSTGYVYLADNDGKLENPGWLVSRSYDNELQRYYIDEDRHACVPGYSKDGWSHYTTDKGYVLRGAATTNGVKRMANNDGKLTEGWIVTDKFGQGLQRYWQEDGAIATSRLIKTGSSSWTYARPEGYVVRGRYVNPTNGNIYLADNDGKLAGTGWIVTNAFDGELQRYYINPTSHAAQAGFFQAPIFNLSASTWFYGVPNLGYVSRGKLTMTPGILISDNEGILAENGRSAGWMITTKYDRGVINRYYLGSSSGHLYAKTGFFTVANKSYYGIPREGYVHRGRLKTANGLLIADNDGQLAESEFNEGWVVTQKYDGHLERYYFKEAGGHLYASTGFFVILGKSFYGFPDQGYVHRGKLRTANGILLATNEGVLAETSNAAGWMVTQAYDSELQRYYLQRVNGHLYAKTGFFRVGNRSYQGLDDQGYVARNTTLVYRGTRCTTNNEGAMRYANGSYVLVSTKTAEATLRILMIGNSFTYYNNNLLAATLGGLLNAEVSVRARSGSTLAEHLNRSTEIGAQTMAALNSYSWDYVIVQERSTDPLDTPNTYYSNLARIVKLAQDHGATPIIYGTWAFSGSGQENSRAGAGAIWRGISTTTMHNRLQSAFQTASSRNDISVANVGNAFANRSFARSLYSSDNKHPSEAGSRLAAQVISDTIKRLQRTA